MMIAVDLRLLKSALLSVAAAAGLLCVFFLIGAIAILWQDRARPQRPYELIISVAGAIYFGVLFAHTLRGVKHAIREDEVTESVRILSQSVLGMFAPIAVAAAALVWLIFQPAY